MPSAFSIPHESNGCPVLCEAKGGIRWCVPLILVYLRSFAARTPAAATKLIFFFRLRGSKEPLFHRGPSGGEHLARRHRLSGKPLYATSSLDARPLPRTRG